MSTSIGMWLGDKFLQFSMATPADLAASAAASAYGIKGAVDTYAGLPAASGLEDGVIYIVRQDAGAPSGNGLYRVQSGAWIYLDSLNLQATSEIVNDSTVTGAKASDALNTLKSADDAKADKVSGATVGNFAGLDAAGNLTDSGSKTADFDVAGAGTSAASAAVGTHESSFDHVGKADKVGSPTVGDFAGLDAAGNLTDSGSKAADFEAAGAAASAVGTHESSFDHVGKADKVSSPTVGNLAGLDAAGNLTDSGSKPADFEVSGAAAAAIVAHNSAANHKDHIAESDYLAAAVTVTRGLLIVPTNVANATVINFAAAAQIAAAAGESITVDLLKGGVTVLTVPITLDSTVAAKTAVAAAISSAALVGGDFLEVAYTYTAGGGPTPMSGIVASLLAQIA